MEWDLVLGSGITIEYFEYSDGNLLLLLVEWDLVLGLVITIEYFEHSDSNPLLLLVVGGVGSCFRIRDYNKIF